MDKIEHYIQYFRVNGGFDCFAVVETLEGMFNGIGLLLIAIPAWLIYKKVMRRGG